MPRTYTTSGVTLLGDGEESGVWGQLTNTNIQILDRMISQAGTISLSGTTHTLTISDGVLSDGQYGVLVFGGSPSGTNTVTISPNDAKRTFVVKNSSGESVVLTQGSGGNVTVLDGRTAIVYCDGAGSGAAVVNVSDALVASTLSDIGALTPTDGNFIVGNGSTWVTESGDTALASLGVTATATELNKLDGVTWTLLDYNTLTATATELNKLDGVTWTLLDYNTLTASAAELNLLDGKTLSGVDSKIVTGNPGDAGHLTRWDVNGDLISYGQATQVESQWEAGTATVETLVSPAKIKAAIEALSIPHVASAATTSGTSHDLTGIPAGVNQIDVFLDGVSQTDIATNGDLLIQLGTSGGLVTSGYSSLSSTYSATRSSTAGFIILNPGALATTNGVYRLRRLADGSDSWIMSGEGRFGATAGILDSWSNAIDIGAVLTQVRLTTVGGTPTFDAGTVSIRCYY
jgi:hypothetical protein